MNPFISAEGEERGYLYEIVTKALAHAGYRLDVQFYPPARAKALVVSGARDILIPTYSSSLDFKELAFSQPLHGSQITYVRWKDQATPLGMITKGMMQANYENTLQLIDMLNQKRINLLVADKYVAANLLVNKRPHLIGKLEFVQPPIIRKDFHVGFSKKKAGYQKNLEKFNAAIEKMQDSGEYQSILLRYGYDNQENDDGKTLSIATVANGDMKLMAEMSRHFLKDHPDVKINWHTMEENLLRRRILASLAMDDGVFDIMTIGAYDTLIYAKNKWIAPLQNFGRNYDVTDILPSVRQSLSLKDTLYAMPFYGESSMTYYRKDLFAKKNLQMPERPRYRDIKALAAKLHDPAQGVYGICLRGKAGWGENTALITTMANSFGARWFDARWYPRLDSEAWRRNGYLENLNLFAKGRCAIWVDATIAAGTLFDRSKSKVADQLGYTHAPYENNQEGSHWIWNWALALSMSSKKKALAQSFMEWASSSQYIQLVGKDKGWIAAPPGTRLSTYSNPSYSSQVPFARFVFDAIQNVKPMRRIHPDLPYQGIQFVEIPEWPAIGNSFGALVSQALRNRLQPAEALARAQEETQRILYHSGYYRNGAVGAAR